MRKTKYKNSVSLLAVVVMIAACRQQMAEQPRYDPLEPSSFFADGQSARPPVQGTVARGQLREDEVFFTGGTGTTVASEFPMPVTMDLLRRGQERYNIYCTPCHDQTGSGNGMIVQRGYARPQSYHTDNVRRQPPGYYVRVMTQGFGAMPSYAGQVPAGDRWAIAAYIRALQLSQHASLGDVPEDQRSQLPQR